MMFYSPKSLFSSVKICLLYLDYSSSETIFTILYNCKTKTAHSGEASS